MSKGNKSLDKTEFLVKIEASADMATQTGVLTERARILNLIKPHLTVCNYQSVTEEECDVCAWLIGLVKQIVAGEHVEA